MHDEPIFEIRATDPTGPDAVEGWARLQYTLRGDRAAASRAMEYAQTMREWQIRNGHVTHISGPASVVRVHYTDGGPAIVPAEQAAAIAAAQMDELVSRPLQNEPGHNRFEKLIPPLIPPPKRTALMGPVVACVPETIELALVAECVTCRTRGTVKAAISPPDFAGAVCVTLEVEPACLCRSGYVVGVPL